MSTAPPPEDVPFVIEALHAAMHADEAAAAAALGLLAARGPVSVYRACLCWAEVIVNFQIGDGVRSGWELETLGPDGQPVDPVSVNREAAWVMRFVIARANRDEDMTFAHFAALGENWPDPVWTLLCLAGGAAHATLTPESENPGG